MGFVHRTCRPSGPTQPLTMVSSACTTCNAAFTDPSAAIALRVANRLFAEPEGSPEGRGAVWQEAEGAGRTPEAGAALPPTHPTGCAAARSPRALQGCPCPEPLSPALAARGRSQSLQWGRPPPVSPCSCSRRGRGGGALVREERGAAGPTSASSKLLVAAQQNLCLEPTPTSCSLHSRKQPGLQDRWRGLGGVAGCRLSAFRRALCRFSWTRACHYGMPATVLFLNFSIGDVNTWPRWLVANSMLLKTVL